MYDTLSEGKEKNNRYKQPWYNHPGEPPAHTNHEVICNPDKEKRLFAGVPSCGNVRLQFCFVLF